MSSDASVLARLDAIEQQNQKLLELVAMLVGGETPPPVEAGISPSRRMEIIQMASDAARSAGRKKSTSREVRA